MWPVCNWLFSLSIMFSSFTWVLTCIKCFIPFYCQSNTQLCLNVIPSSIDAYFYCCYFLAFMNNAAMKLIHRFPCEHNLFISWYIPRNGIIGVVILCLSFWETARLFFKVVAPHCCIFPPAVYEGSHFCIFPTLEITSFVIAILVGTKGDLFTGTDLHFLVAAHLSCVAVHLRIFFGKLSV